METRKGLLNRIQEETKNDLSYEKKEEEWAEAMAQ